jgi:hypothetical protein
MRLLRDMLVMINVLLYMLGCITVGSFIGILLLLRVVHATGFVLAPLMLVVALYVTDT